MTTDEDLTVRRARTDDIPGLVASSAGLFAEDAGTRDPSVDVDWPREHGAASFTTALADPGRLVLVVVHEGEVVGHLTGSLTEPSAVRPVKSATLNGLYVRPAHRRSRAGARLVADFLAWAEAQGARQAEVAAYSANPEAIRFYERQGFGAHAVTLRRALGRKAEVESGSNDQTDRVS
ncbi:GNAT superfamily N-acetyltransferase [Streptomyces sp. SAI-208]|uniref:GNAT family N-acetyltransferase n=1 Tax=Streptomyces sp. SAI-208 TaxID=2940550 RepID=UPI002476F9EE|nr:GNAT family N-acetyltransferase [Streptomyces sp. SAI-208]MDH6605497.1 GNAT superfamily N-acetyltransferase [Streptomyces sp. SAI-208]